MMEILHITSLAEHTTLNIYKPMEFTIKRSPQHRCPSMGSNSELFAHENDAKEGCLFSPDFLLTKYFFVFLNDFLFQSYQIFL